MQISRYRKSERVVSLVLVCIVLSSAAVAKFHIFLTS